MQAGVLGELHVTEHTESKMIIFYEWTALNFANGRKKAEMFDVHQITVNLVFGVGNFIQLPPLTRDVTRQHYHPVLSDVSLSRFSKRRRRLKFRLTL